MENGKITKKEVYSYTKQSKKAIVEYNFWRTPYESWKIIKTIYDVDEGSYTVEMTIPDEVLNKMLTDTAKEELSNEQ